MKRRNILLIHSDQHRADCLGLNDPNRALTPNLDRLGREGVNFTSAFTPCPICSPARASLMTGAWPTTHGCLCVPKSELYRPARRELPVLTDLLKAAGYGVGYVGKYHGELKGGLEGHGVDEAVYREEYPAWRGQAGIPDLPQSRGLFGEVDEQCPPEGSSLAWQARHVIRMMQSMAGGESPFLLRWDPQEPHLPCHPTPEFAAQYDSGEIEPWSSWDNGLEGKPSAQLRQKRLWGVDGWSWDKWRETVLCYLAIITELDFHVGRVVSELGRLGLDEDTVIIYTSDHGDYCGGHGQIDKHYAMYDDLVKVPLILRDKQLSSSGTSCDRFAMNELDVARTILELAGVEPPETFVGQSLYEMAAGEGSARDSVFAQYFGVLHGACSQRMVRDRKFKYVYSPTLVDELYDLEADPAELSNLAGDRAYAPQLQSMKRRMVRWMEETRDPLLNRWSRVELAGAPSLAQEVGL